MSSTKKGLLFRPDLTVDTVAQLRIWKEGKQRKISVREHEKQAAAACIPLAREIAGLATTLKRF